jgi:ssDNA-binding replication factor A large subunit
VRNEIWNNVYSCPCGNDYETFDLEVRPNRCPECKCVNEPDQSFEVHDNPIVEDDRGDFDIFDEDR